MRRTLLLLTLPLAYLATPMPAQGFEGTITLKLDMGQQMQVNPRYMIKGNKMAVVMTTNAGGMGPMEIRMITDMAAGKTIMLMPMPAGMAGNMPGMADAKGFKMEIPFDSIAASDSKDKVEVKALGTHQTIAGMKCDDYAVSSNGKVTENFCLSTDLGRFIFPSGRSPFGGRRGSSAGEPAWAKVLAEKGGFPLKVWDPDGKVQMEVLSVERGKVPDDTFAIPDGYVDPTAMFGRGRGGGGGR